MLNLVLFTDLPASRWVESRSWENGLSCLNLNIEKTLNWWVLLHCFVEVRDIPINYSLDEVILLFVSDNWCSDKVLN